MTTIDIHSADNISALHSAPEELARLIGKDYEYPLHSYSGDSGDDEVVDLDEIDFIRMPPTVVRAGDWFCQLGSKTPLAVEVLAVLGFNCIVLKDGTKLTPQEATRLWSPTSEEALEPKSMSPRATDSFYKYVRHDFLRWTEDACSLNDSYAYLGASPGTIVPMRVSSAHQARVRAEVTAYLAHVDVKEDAVRLVQKNVRDGDYFVRLGEKHTTLYQAADLNDDDSVDLENGDVLTRDADSLLWSAGPKVYYIYAGPRCDSHNDCYMFQKVNHL